MSQRRTLILVAAILIGALSSFLVWNYVNGIQDEAYSEAERVPVFLVKQPMPEGTSGVDAQAYIAKEEIPRKFLPSNAITSMEDISGKVALNSLVPNQVVVSDMFVAASDPRAQQSFAQRLQKIGNTDMVTATIQVDVTKGVAGLIQPGDYVNVLVLRINANAGADGAATPEANPALFQTGARYLYQKVQVLAVDKSAVPEAGSAEAAAADDGVTAPVSNAGLLTLIVPAKGAQYLASLTPEQIYLSLVALDYEPKVQDQIDPEAPLPAEDPAVLTPYGPDGAVAATD